MKSIDTYKCESNLYLGMRKCALVELLEAERAGPGALGRRVERGRQAVHVVAAVTVVAEQQLVLTHQHILLNTT